MPARALPTLALLVVGTALASAMESDFRVLYERPFGDTTVSSATTSDSHRWDHAERWEAQWLAVFGVPLLAVHAGIGGVSERRSDPGAAYKVLAGELLLGARLTVIPEFLHLEANGELGYGRADLDLGGQGSGQGTWKGESLGLDLVATVPVPGILTAEVGVGAGWLHGQSSHDIAGQNVDVTADNNVYGRIFVGVAF
jgi:hypothetical protein